MSKKTKIILTTVVVVISICSYLFYQTFYAPHRDIASEKPVLVLLAATLQLEYVNNDDDANKTYADKVIAISGVITALEQNTVILDHTVQVDFLHNIGETVNQGDSLSVKGRCVGYDDLLEVVKLDQAIILTNK